MIQRSYINVLPEQRFVKEYTTMTRLNAVEKRAVLERLEFA